MRTLCVCLFLALTFAAEADAVGNGPRELNWRQLAPDTTEIDNPFLRLSVEQTWMFRKYLRESQVTDKEHTAEQLEELRTLRAELEADGLEPDEMVVRYEELKEKYQQAETAIRPEVLGAPVRLPGYLLPLSVQDGTVTEFLLVPTVGACIHAPPPPPNQVVFVRFDKGFRNAGLFDPVWIRGELKAADRTEQLYLMDGASDVSVSYAMDAEAVWLY